MEGLLLKTTNGGVTFGQTKSDEIKTKNALGSNYPNPFNPKTKIKFEIPGQSLPVGRQIPHDITLVTFKVYDVLGNKIITFVNEEKPAGTYEVEFDGTGLTSGIYFYQLKAGNFVETKKMLLLK